ncbi:MAG: alpha/beta fold hydrolase [Chloroflexi bacterium]|nr:MAG: alpha/beta fold hydrolase [Chloroflexota bacterium]
MRPLYPEIEPHEHGMLDVGDGNLVSWETCGNPRGKPALVLHGGPGSGRSPWFRRLFDPSAYRVVLFDQRGCGRSTLHASALDTGLATNTTWRLIDDAERLREQLAIERWLVLGGSWGSTWGLAYAEAHPDHVTEMILFGVTTGRRKEFDWTFRGGLSILFLWESTTLDWPPRIGLAERFRDPVYAMAFARIVTHYVRHNAWLEDGVLLRGVASLTNIAGTLVNGRFDFQAPIGNAWELHRVWPNSEIVIVDNAGHGGSALITEALIRATDAAIR